MLKVNYSVDLQEAAEECLINAFKQGNSISCPPSYVVDSALMVLQGVGFYQESDVFIPLTDNKGTDNE